MFRQEKETSKKSFKLLFGTRFGLLNQASLIKTFPLLCPSRNSIPKTFLLQNSFLTQKVNKDENTIFKNIFRKS